MSSRTSVEGSVLAPYEKSVEQSNAAIKTCFETALQAHKFSTDKRISVHPVNQGVGGNHGDLGGSLECRRDR